MKSSDYVICSKCGARHTAKEWNEETAKEFVSPTKIQDSAGTTIFICPSCGYYLPSMDLEVETEGGE